MYTWNNTDLETMGIVVESYPNMPKAESNVTTFTTLGRDGYVAFDEGTYQPIIIELKCHFNPNLTTATYEQARAFLNGFGMLSFDGTTEYSGYVYGTIDFDKVNRTEFRRFVVQFACQPFRHSIQSKTFTYTTFPQTLVVGGTTYTRPIIELEGSGDNTLTINSKGFIIYGMETGRTYTIDCQLMNIYDDLGNNCSNMMRFGFPKLVVGNNTIESGTSGIAITDGDGNIIVDDDGAVMTITGTSGITSMKITYKEAWL